MRAFYCSVLTNLKSRSIVSFAASLVFFFCLVQGTARVSAQSVVPDGNSNTSIQINGEGLITVDIAPANSASISHNTYSHFSVPSIGVQLDNNLVGAQTILNEVTSASVSRIEGPLTVIGPKSDVIIANPNGIIVDGGRFQNTGNVALTTGRIELNTGGSVSARVNAGEIVVGANGLSGTMQELALVSKRLRVGGPLSFDDLSSSSLVNAIVGSGVTSFDRDRNNLGVDGLGVLPWAFVEQSSLEKTENLLVEITPKGSVSAGRIGLTVTDQGAGVRFAGDQLASAGEFRLSNSGRLELESASITASGSVSLDVGSFRAVSSAEDRAKITSEESGVTINSQQGSVELGQTQITGRIVASDNLASSGGITILSAGEISTSQANGVTSELVSDAGELPNNLATSSIVLRAQGNVNFSGLLAESTDDFDLATNGRVTFEDSRVDAGRDFRVLSDKSLSFDMSNVSAGSDVRLDGSDLRFGANSVDQLRTEILANSGAVTANATKGSILNFGSLIQGNQASPSDSMSEGGVTLLAFGDLLNTSLSVERLGVIFGQEGDLVVRVGQDVKNQTGRLFSNSGISISAGGDILNETLFTDASRPISVQRSKGSRYAGSLFLKRERRTNISANFGEQLIAGEQSFILGIGDVFLEAQNVRSVGSDISGANVSIIAQDEFDLQARQVGSVYFVQKCKLFCKTYGLSTLRLSGGTLTASQDLNIEAGTRVVSLAGTISGRSGITIDAPLIEIIPAFSPELIQSPAGLSGFFSGRRGYILPVFQYGSLQSSSGSITLNGNTKLGELNIFSSGEFILSGSRIESARPAELSFFDQKPIGIFWNVFD